MPVFLKKVEIFGFKSFADRCKIEFHSPITAIIGPNGSGKSNIIDSIRWVLGESSLKVLRGDTFEDILFSGSQYRSSLSVAEVSLTFDNTSRILQLPFDEIEITKRYYRSGEGKVLINGQEARVKDVISLFLGTGFGKEGYAIVGQGEVDRLVVGTPQEKRNYVDELLGLSKVKFKKKEAEKKLQDINHHLSVLTVKLEATEKEYLRLKNESEKLQVYKRLSEELENFEKIYIYKRVKSYQNEINHLKKEREKLQRQLDERYHIREKLSSQITTIDEKIQNENSILSIERERLSEIEKQMKSKEIDKKSLESKIEMSKKTIELYQASIKKETLRIEELLNEKQLLIKKISEIEKEIGDLNFKLESLRSEISNLERQKAILEEEKNNVVERFQIIKDDLREIENSLLSIRFLNARNYEIAKTMDELGANISNLDNMLKEKESQRNSISEELNRLNFDKDEMAKEINSVSKMIQETEIEINNLQSLINTLSKTSETLFKEFSNNISSSALRVGEFISKVDFVSQKIISICDTILGIDIAINDVKSSIDEIKSLSLSIYEDIKTLPFLSSATEFLSKKIEIDEKMVVTKNRINELNHKLTASKEILSQLKEKYKETVLVISVKTEEMRRYEKEINATINEMKVYQNRLFSLKNEKNLLGDQLLNLEKKIKNLMEEVKEYCPDIEIDIQNDIEDINALLKNTMKKVSERFSVSSIDFELQSISSTLYHRKNELTQIEIQTSILSSDRNSSLDRINKIDEEIDKIDVFIKSRQDDIKSEESNIVRNTSEVEILSSQINELSASRDSLLKFISDKSYTIKELTQEYRKALSERDILSEEISKIEKELSVLDQKISTLSEHLENLEEEFLEKYGVRIDEIESVGVDQSVEEIGKIILQLKNEIKRIGFINESALEQFEKIKEEYNYLMTNLNDILQGKQRIEDMIRNIDNEIHTIVSKSITSISDIISNIFKEVFAGGGVEIKINDDDLVDGGIELIVNIPGKKIRNLFLLSGGEKALVGIIFIFSALLINNTPVVIMDEVDAPLDDENTERFKKLILAFQDRAQFIIVSHNKSTIEICQDIYGVTMEEKGVSKIVSYRLQDVLT
ncbi:MAG: AAA family ATPase [Brevinematales bacterium]|nr:AAA family ATPase [Brevinematales bacterium]